MRGFARCLTPWIALAAMAASIAWGQQPPGLECQQPRFTGKAPDEYYSLKNPLDVPGADPQPGQNIYGGEIEGVNCAVCHGKKGNGKGVLAKDYVPPPRNFQCTGTIRDIPDGQLFWIIKFGSPKTEMPDHRKLTDEQIWQLIVFVRQLAK